MVILNRLVRSEFNNYGNSFLLVIFVKRQSSGAWMVERVRIESVNTGFISEDFQSPFMAYSTVVNGFEISFDFNHPEIGAMQSFYSLTLGTDVDLMNLENVPLVDYSVGYWENWISSVPVRRTGQDRLAGSGLDSISNPIEFLNDLFGGYKGKLPAFKKAIEKFITGIQGAISAGYPCDTSDQVGADRKICGGRAATYKRDGREPDGAKFRVGDRDNILQAANENELHKAQNLNENEDVVFGGLKVNPKVDKLFLWGWQKMIHLRIKRNVDFLVGRSAVVNLMFVWSEEVAGGWYLIAYDGVQKENEVLVTLEESTNGFDFIFREVENPKYDFPCDIFKPKKGKVYRHSLSPDLVDRLIAADELVDLEILENVEPVQRGDRMKIIDYIK